MEPWLPVARKGSPPASRWVESTRSIVALPKASSSHTRSRRSSPVANEGAVEVEEEGEMGCGIAIEIAVFCLCCSGGAAQALSEGAAGHAQFGFLRE